MCFISSVPAYNNACNETLVDKRLFQNKYLAREQALFKAYKDDIKLKSGTVLQFLINWLGCQDNIQELGVF
jgi:hypothetical protein